MYLQFVVQSYIFSTIDIFGIVVPWPTSYNKNTCKRVPNYLWYLEMLHFHLQVQYNRKILLIDKHNIVFYFTKLQNGRYTCLLKIWQESMLQWVLANDGTNVTRSPVTSFSLVRKILCLQILSILIDSIRSTNLTSAKWKIKLGLLA